MGGTFYGLDMDLIKSLNLENMITPHQPEQTQKPNKDDDKDFETLRRENSMIESNS